MRVAVGYPPAMLALPLLLAACGDPDLESVVDVPTTLETLQARHAPPAAVLEVREETRSGGGGACGHAAICLVLVPILLYDAVFPTKWQEATLTEGGAVVWRGRFDMDGELLDAEVREGDRWRALRVMELEELERRLVVEAASAPAGPDGAPGTWAPTPVLGQVDLAAAYLDALHGQRNPERRAALMGEAWRHLGAEAVPFLAAWLGSERDDAAMAGTLGIVCANEGLSVDDWDKTRTAALPLLAAMEPHAGVRTAGAALACFGDADPAAGTWAGRLATMACAGAEDWTSGFPYLASRVDANPAVKAAAEAAAPTCAPGAGRAALWTALHRQPDGADLAPALVSLRSRELVIGAVRVERPDHRAAVVAALQEEAKEEELLDLLVAAKAPPTAAEVPTLADVYLREGGFLHEVWPVRARTLALLARVRGRPEAALATARLATAPFDAEDVEDRAAIAIALAVLGDDARAWDALRLAPPSYAQEDVEAVYTAGSLVALGLHFLGCDAPTLDAAVATAKAGGGSGSPCPSARAGAR